LEFHNEVSPSVVSALSKTDEATKKKIKEEVFATLSKKYPNEEILMDFSTLVIYGEK
jgi:hypothetical protein